eukprot:g81488.t1
MTPPDATLLLIVVYSHPHTPTEFGQMISSGPQRPDPELPTRPSFDPTITLVALIPHKCPARARCSLFFPLSPRLRPEPATHQSKQLFQTPKLKVNRTLRRLVGRTTCYLLF